LIIKAENILSAFFSPWCKSP